MTTAQHHNGETSSQEKSLSAAILGTPDGIEIIFDKTRRISGDDVTIYAADSDYFVAYTTLQSAIKQQQNMRVVVHSHSLKTWLVQGLSKYTRVTITGKDLTYRDLLASKWQLSSFDLALSDAQIRQQKLLDLPIKGTQPQSLSSFICQAFLSPYLDNPQCPTAHFGELLTELLAYHKSRERMPGIIAGTYKQRIHGWAESTPECAELLRELMDDCQSVYETCCLYTLTANYPEDVRIKCVGAQKLRAIQQSGIHVNGLNIAEFDPSSSANQTTLTNELRLFFHAFEARHPTPTRADMEELLGYCSGALAQEAEYILRLLKGNMHLITAALVTRIKTTFTALLPLYHQHFEDLRAYAPPPKPAAFPQDADTQTVIDWAVREYLPYKFWLETTRQTEPDILAYGEAFANYLCERYQQISYHSPHVLYRFLFNYRSLIAETPVPILLIIDNFNYKFFQTFQTAMAKYSILPRQIDPYLSLLPSITGLSKKGMISGKRNQEEAAQYSYDKNLKEHWQGYFPRHAMKYLSKAGELDEYTPSDYEFIVINYLEIDTELHKSYQKTAIEHRQAVIFVIEHLTKLLAHFITRNHLETRTRIFLVSDHGSTLIPESLPNGIDIEYFKGQTAESKHRYLSLSDARFESMRQNINIADSVFFLDKNTSGDGKNYVLAKGYNRFKEIREDFYVHGGALPEEVILPVGCFEYGVQEFTPLIVQLAKTEYRLLSKETLMLRLANPNALPVSNLLIKVLAHDALLTTFELTELSGDADRELSQAIRIRRKEMDMLRCDIYYEIAGNSVQETVEFQITIKTMTQAKFDFDEW